MLKLDDNAESMPHRQRLMLAMRALSKAVWVARFGLCGQSLDAFVKCTPRTMRPVEAVLGRWQASGTPHRARDIAKGHRMASRCEP